MLAWNNMKSFCKSDADFQSQEAFSENGAASASIQGARSPEASQNSQATSTVPAASCNLTQSAADVHQVLESKQEPFQQDQESTDAQSPPFEGIFMEQSPQPRRRRRRKRSTRNPPSRDSSVSSELATTGAEEIVESSDAEPETSSEVLSSCSHQPSSSSEAARSDLPENSLLRRAAGTGVVLLIRPQQAQCSEEAQEPGELAPKQLCTREALENAVALDPQALQDEGDKKHLQIHQLRTEQQTANQLQQGPQEQPQSEEAEWKKSEDQPRRQPVEHHVRQEELFCMDLQLREGGQNDDSSKNKTADEPSEQGLAKLQQLTDAVPLQAHHLRATDGQSTDLQALQEKHTSESVQQEEQQQEDQHKDSKMQEDHREQDVTLEKIQRVKQQMHQQSEQLSMTKQISLSHLSMQETSPHMPRGKQPEQEEEDRADKEGAQNHAALRSSCQQAMTGKAQPNFKQRQQQELDVRKRNKLVEFEDQDIAAASKKQEAQELPDAENARRSGTSDPPESLLAMRRSNTGDRTGFDASITGEGLPCPPQKVQLWKPSLRPPEVQGMSASHRQSRRASSENTWDDVDQTVQLRRSFYNSRESPEVSKTLFK